MESNKNQQSILTLLICLWHHISQRRRMQFVILFSLMILSSFAEVAGISALLPFLSVLTSPSQVFNHQLAQPFIQTLGLTEPSQLLLPITIAFSIAILFSGAMRLLLLWAQTRFGHAIGADISISIYRRTLYQPYAVHVARNSSEIIAGIIGKVNIVVGSTLMPVLIIISSSLMLSTILFTLFAIEPRVTLAAIAGFGTIYAFVILFTKKVLKRNSQCVSHESNQIIKTLQEGLGGIRDVLIDGTQATYCKTYGTSDLRFRRAQANIKIIANSPRFGIEALGMVLIASLAYFLSQGPEGIDSSIPVLGVMALGAQRLLPVMQQFYSSWSSLRGSQSSLSDALDLLGQPLPDHAEMPLPEPIPFQHSITLKKVSFRFAPPLPCVLHDMDLTISKGSRFGFIGATGSGKSTLLDIIMGLLHPTEGSLAIDDVAISPQNYRSWQAHIAHVPQNIFLADSTIAENIAFGVPTDQIDLDRVRQAAQKAHVAQTIESFSQQYNTKVGERGIRLSGGQRQRIGIARALYKQADVIVFDEATSALDNDTECAVMQAIESLSDELTILIVAHRLTTLKNCTHVIELADGKVQRSGTYQEIVGTDA